MMQIVTAGKCTGRRDTSVNGISRPTPLTSDGAVPISRSCAICPGRPREAFSASLDSITLRQQSVELCARLGGCGFGLCFQNIDFELSITLGSLALVFGLL